MTSLSSKSLKTVKINILDGFGMGATLKNTQFRASNYQIFRPKPNFQGQMTSQTREKVKECQKVKNH